MNVFLSFFFRLNLNANLYHCPGKLNVWNDAVGMKVNFFVAGSCCNPLSTLKRSSSYASIKDVKFPAPSVKSDTPISCVMNTVLVTSYNKKIKLI